MRIHEEQRKMKIEVEDERRREAEKAKETNKQNFIASQQKQEKNQKQDFDSGTTQDTLVC